MLGSKASPRDSYITPVKWSTSAAAWNRRDRILASVLAAGAALGLLVKALGAPWLVAVLLFGVFAAVGAVARAVMVTHGVAVEAAIEKAERERLLRAPIGPVEGVDPTEIGVDAAAQTVLAGNRLPEYVPRIADAALTACVRDAISGVGPWIVVASGPPKTGKSRAIFEALRHQHVALDLVAPVDADALRSLITPGSTPTPSGTATVLWLDDLEPFVNAGVNVQTLRGWRATVGCGIVVATYGGKGSDVVPSSGSALTTLADDLLQHAREIPVDTTTPAELLPLRSELDESVMTLLERHGLAAYLVAGPKLERKLVTQRHTPGEPPCPEGAAIVRVAVDWSRCGRTDPIPRGTIRQLWPRYLPGAFPATDTAFESGLGWATRPVEGTIALLVSVVGERYTPYDYVVRLVSDNPAAVPPPEEMWTCALADAADARALAVAASANRYAQFVPTVSALSRAGESEDETVASIASQNLVRLWEVTRENLSTATADQLARSLKELEKNPSIARELCGTVVISYPDEEHDRSPYLDKGVRQFLNDLYDRIPYLLYYLAQAPLAGSFLGCVAAHALDEAVTADPDGGLRVRMNDQTVSTLALRLWQAADFARHVGDDPHRLLGHLDALHQEDLRDRLTDSLLDPDLFSAAGGKPHIDEH